MNPSHVAGRSNNASATQRAPKGVDLGDLLMLFAKDKLVMSAKGAHDHLTLHFGPKSKVLDLHKTYTTTDGSRSHQTLFKITHENLQRLLEELAVPLLEGLMSTTRPLTPSYMHERRYGAIVGPLPTQANLARAIEVRRRRLTINDEKLAAEYRVPRYIDELYDLADGKIFVLVSYANRGKPRRVGFGFPVTGKRRRPRLIWIPDRLLEKQIDRLGELLFATAVRLGTVTTGQETAAPDQSAASLASGARRGPSICK